MWSLSFVLVVGLAMVIDAAYLQENVPIQSKSLSSDGQTAASERFFDLTSLFNRNPYYYNTQRPSYYPSTYGGYNPGYYPQSGYPQGGAAYPYPGGQYPAGGYPTGGGGYGTNFIGGNGGYGGFGGNGGLSTYYGYNSNNYYGNRNVGYGYYRDTNTNGFPRSGNDYYSNTALSGYRGYS